MLRELRTRILLALLIAAVLAISYPIVIRNNAAMTGPTDGTPSRLMH
jgi:hypothetical protein